MRGGFKQMRLQMRLETYAVRAAPPRAVLSETFFVAGAAARPVVAAMLRREILICDFTLHAQQAAILGLMDKYANVPMSLADACLVRMTETLQYPMILTTDADFRIYRRHSRQVVPCLLT
jgi:uncharacterized protein